MMTWCTNMAQIICVYVVHASLLKFPMNNNDLEGLAYTNEMVCTIQVDQDKITTFESFKAKTKS